MVRLCQIFLKMDLNPSRINYDWLGFIYKRKPTLLCSRFIRILDVLSQQYLQTLTSENTVSDLHSFFTLFFYSEYCLVIHTTYSINFLFLFFRYLNFVHFYLCRILRFRLDVCFVFFV